MTLHSVEHWLSTRLRPEGLLQTSIDRYAIKKKKRNKDRLIKTIDANDYQSLVCHRISQG